MSALMEARIEAMAELHAHEMGGTTAEERDYERFLVQAAKFLGVTDLDEDEDEAGYSLDSASAAHAAGIGPEDYAKGVRA